MLPNFWIGVIVIVFVLETIRIGLSTYVLIHILEHYTSDPGDEQPGMARHSLQTARDRARREALLPSTLDALRGAMDEVTVDRSDGQVDRAIIALDRYIDQLQMEGRRS